jgi:ketosteroid isomerase-like protein
MRPTSGGTPEGAVRSWWRAWAEKDLDALGRLAREDYLEFTGHSVSHRVGHNTLMEVAREAFGLVTIVRWELCALQELQPMDEVAVMGYRWKVLARRGDGTLRIHGVATDILVREDLEWRYLSHHSTQMGEEAG